MKYVSLLIEEESLNKVRKLLEDMLGEELNIRTLSFSEDYDSFNNVENAIQTESEKQKTINDVSVELLHKIGVTNNLNGYRYIIDAVVLCIEDPGMLDAMLDKLYPAIAEKNNTEDMRVERSIRYAIESIFNGSKGKKVIEEVFGHTMSSKKEKLTNSQFLSIFVEKVKIECNL